MLGVSCIVVNWNAGDALVDTVRSLLALRTARPVEVLLVDNASTDGSADRAAALGPSVRVLRNPTNRGLAAANNQGFAAASHDLLLVCNPDVVVAPGAVDELAACLDRHPRAAWAVPRLRRPDGSVQVAVGDLPTLPEALLGVRRRRGGFWWHDWGHDEEIAVGHAAEACYLVRREAIDAFGPQDERFSLDWEGIDWAARAADAGWEIWFCPTAEVVHVGGVTLRQVPLRWVVGTHRGIYRYFADRSPTVARPFLWVAVALRATAKAGAVLLGAWSYRHAVPDAG